MECSFSSPSLIYFKLFPFVSRLLSFKYGRMSCFISVLYIMILTKLKLRSLPIKSMKRNHFKNLMKQNKYQFDFNGDVYSCVLISINTLIALSISNMSWIKIYNHPSNNSEQSGVKWRIKLPPVSRNLENPEAHDNCYHVQCLCISNVSEDFTLFVTEDKLFNITKLGVEESNYCDLLSEVLVENTDQELPKIAKSASVTAISSAYDINPEDYEYALGCYFSKPKLLKVGDVFSIDLKNLVKHIKSNIMDVDSIHFKVTKLSGEPSINDLYYIFKGSTSLYLNPPIHGYLPQTTTRFNEFNASISYCPDGLHKQYEYLQQMFRPFLTMLDLDLKPVFLLSGPKGSGKKTTLKAVAASFGLHLIQADCFDFYGVTPSLVHGKLLQVFSRARRTLPCIVYLENVELLGRDKNLSENPRLVEIFLSQLEELWLRKTSAYPVFVVGSTHSKSEDFVPRIARLFVETVSFGVLKPKETYKALKWLVMDAGMTCVDESLQAVGEKCRGYLHDDLELLIKHAVCAQLETSDPMKCNNRELSLEHFEKALEIMDAAYSDSIGAAKVPTVHWEDIGGLGSLKEEIMLTLNMPLKHPELFGSELKRSGIIFYGPPGTGKTLLAKAIATECNYNFLSVKGPELMNMYVGESERNVREVFARARDAAPCIVFFDELDSLAPCRGKSGDSGGVTDRVVSQLLAEMDGLEENKDVFVLGATNRPDLVDPALLRPGRFDKMFHVGMCSDKESKLNVLNALTRRFTLDADVDLSKVAEKLPGDVSGADLYSVSSNAWFSAARKAVNDLENGRKISLPLVVCAEDFDVAVNEFVPSLSDEDIQYYKRLNESEVR